MLNLPLRLPRYTRAAAILVIALVFTAAAAPTLIRTASGRKTLDDFDVVYTGARAILAREDIHAATAGMYIYSPFLAFVFQPLGLLPKRVAAVAWLILIATIILAAAIIASRKIADTWQFSVTSGRDRASPSLVSAGALLLSFTKIRSEFILGQTDCLILLGLALILYCLDRRPQLAALAIGVTANFKYLTLIFVPYFIVKRNYRAASSSIAWFVFFFLLPALEVGARLISDYIINAVAVLAKVIGGLDHGALGDYTPVVNSIAWTNSISLTSTIFRVTRSLQISGAIAAIVIALLLIAIVAALVWIGCRYDVDIFRPATSRPENAHAQTNSIEWATLIGFALIFGPQTTARHMIMLMLVYNIGLTLVLVEQRCLPRILLIGWMIATAVALSLPFRQTGVHPTLVALKSAGTASWSALLLLFSIVVIGCQRILGIDRCSPKTHRSDTPNLDASPKQTPNGHAA